MKSVSKLNTELKIEGRSQCHHEGINFNRILIDKNHQPLYSFIDNDYHFLMRHIHAGVNERNEKDVE